MNSLAAPLYHVTVLSNFARAFDKYQRLYPKSAIPESTFPGEFYVLQEGDLAVGVDKAARLLTKTGFKADRLIALESCLPRNELSENSRTGLGLVWPSPDLPISRLREINADGSLGKRISVEEATAESLELHSASFWDYQKIRPRSLSFLPIANGCDASCPFCFSNSSVSLDQRQAGLDWPSVEGWIASAAEHGAERAMITGGGEPTLLPWPDLVRLVKICARVLPKVVLITNGARLAGLAASEIASRLKELDDAGLSVLAISRHLSDEARNTALMRLETQTPRLLNVYQASRAALRQLRLRLICVLQRGGVETVADIEKYMQWVIAHRIEEVCFKELYVSTSRESIYYSREANDWSARHQISLSRVHEWAQSHSLNVTDRLPWGAPIYSGDVNGGRVRVAAYTEPSLFWERLHGVARSWNVMADGRCMASLEDRQSVVSPNSVR